MENPDSANRADLMAAVIEHLACYIQTGRPRSARLAALLLDRLAVDFGTEDMLRERCRQLCDVLEYCGEDPKTSPAPVRNQQTPWLTWECLGEAA